MRGNEWHEAMGTRGIEKFPIPMRGNESLITSALGPSPAGFRSP